MLIQEKESSLLYEFINKAEAPDLKKSMRYLDKLEDRFSNSSREFEVTTRMNLKQKEINKMMKQFKKKYSKMKISDKQSAGIAISSTVDNSTKNTSRITPATMEQIVISINNSGIKKKPKKKKTKKSNQVDSFRYAQSMLDLSDNIINVAGSTNSRIKGGDNNSEVTEDQVYDSTKVMVEILKPTLTKQTNT